MENPDYLSHAGKKGMKWGYNDGVLNGKRTANNTLVTNSIGETISDFSNIGYNQKAIIAAKEFIAKNMKNIVVLPSVVIDRSGNSIITQRSKRTYNISIYDEKGNAVGTKRTKQYYVKTGKR